MIRYKHDGCGALFDMSGNKIDIKPFVNIGIVFCDILGEDEHWYYVILYFPDGDIVKAKSLKAYCGLQLQGTKGDSHITGIAREIFDGRFNAQQTNND